MIEEFKKAIAEERKKGASEARIAAIIRAANVLLVEGAGSTIHIPLDQSTMALNRLDACFAKNSSAIETNPFVAPKRQP